ASSPITFILLFSVFAGAVLVRAQDVKQSIGTNGTVADSKPKEEQLPFSVEKINIEGGAELITIFYRMNGTFDRPATDTERGPVPLVSVLRDTLGDDLDENDKLRYLWMLTYTKPTTTQKLFSMIPFFYRRGSSKAEAGKTIPPAIMNFSSSGMSIEPAIWEMLTRSWFGAAGNKVKLIYGPFRGNREAYKKAAITEALTIISLYQQVAGENGLNDQELLDLQTRLGLTDKMFGGLMQQANFLRANDKMYLESTANRGQTRELLRRFTEAAGLYFQPLEMPNGDAKHAIAWVFKEDLEANKTRVWNGRFLNIKSPWGDEQLLNWKGYSEVRWFDAESREVEPGTPGAVSKTLIPLAVYGLDHPKIPIILVDFRDIGNPKKREMTKRALDDVMGNVFSLSQGGGRAIAYGRFIYNFVTGRRGTDLNQPTRVRAYSQLKMILAMDDSLNDDLRKEIETRLERVSLNPLENDLAAELNLARGQYKNLVEYAKSPDGLRLKLEKDRIREMTLAAHDGKMPLFYSIAKYITFGLYEHRVKPTSELMAKVDIKRQLDFHERKIRETAYFSVRPEVDANVNELMRSLTFVAQNGRSAGGKTATAIGKIFAATEEDDIRNACLAGLFRMNSKGAREVLTAINNDQKYELRWREAASEYLKRGRASGQVSKRDGTVTTTLQPQQ
ncbi:MAG: hypothetical protein ACJ72Z_00485, partial [Pyrinomonadaceae bacterium]